MSLWQKNQGERYIKALHLKPWRVVEAQHILTTRTLVDSIEEHEILEQLIESSKPPIGHDKNYLIATPFRYPPLPYGSRFGSFLEPSIWYGAQELETAFAEVSYYLQKFRNDSSADLGILNLVHTAFSTNIRTTCGIRLEEPPFQQYRALIADKDNYQHSQALGIDMRQASVEAFTFFSARSLHNGINIGIFSAAVFTAEQNNFIFNQQTWFCYASQDKVEFTRSVFGKKISYCFPSPK